MCTLLGCPEMLTCSLQCIDLMMTPPSFSISCVGDCVARGCPAASYLFDQVFDCFVANIATCGASISCLMTTCQAQVSVCLGKLSCN